jgi:hypothetical protein
MIRRVVQVCMVEGASIWPPINEEIETFRFYTTTNGKNCDILCKSGTNINLTHAEVLESNGDDPSVLSFRIVGLEWNKERTRLIGQEIWVISTNPQPLYAETSPDAPEVPHAS